MTREDIARSLKPIRWTYIPSLCVYVTTLDGVGIRLRIEHEMGDLDAPYIMGKTERDMILSFLGPFDTLDEAMGAARDMYIDEVCALFELNG